MLPDAPTLTVFLAAAAALALTPRPDMLYVASRALGQGRAAGASASRPGRCWRKRSDSG